MDEVIMYVRYNLSSGTDTDGLIQHLSRIGYRFAFDPKLNALFAWDEECQYVETIMEDNGIEYEREEY